MTPPPPKEDTIKCATCGGSVSADAKFCEHCGAEIEHVKPGIKPCISCGAEIKEAAKFCPECGSSQEPKPAACPGCGVELANPNAKFCLECGHRL